MRDDDSAMTTTTIRLLDRPSDAAWAVVVRASVALAVAGPLAGVAYAAIGWWLAIAVGTIAAGWVVSVLAARITVDREQVVIRNGPVRRSIGRRGATLGSRSPLPRLHLLSIVSGDDAERPMVVWAAFALRGMTRSTIVSRLGLPHAPGDGVRDYMKKKGLHPPDMSMMPPGDAWLLAEFGGKDKQESDASARKCMDDFNKREHPPGMKLF